jgi:hypothetical protein
MGGHNIYPDNARRKTTVFRRIIPQRLIDIYRDIVFGAMGKKPHVAAEAVGAIAAR